MELRMDIERLCKAIHEIFDMTIENIVENGTGIAAEMQDYAKKNAPWTDRTGRARRSLSGFCEERYDGVYIGVLGGMPYSPDLELSYGKRYAILVPTVNEYAPLMIDRIRAAVAEEGGLTLG